MKRLIWGITCSRVKVTAAETRSLPTRSALTPRTTLSASSAIAMARLADS